ncbi:MAG: YdaS family helix-turn-helix protein [Pacificimonas sp.]|jgi:DNA-binding transcriptional regulator YdaS (Cro superfamily)|nr:YdaS family helix-turn-helix protein [Pacificimonas sp.]
MTNDQTPARTRFEALCACVEAAKSQSALARDLGVSQNTVWKWLNSGKQMPSVHVLKAERLYGVSRHELRPDIYPRDYPPAPDAADDFGAGYDEADQRFYGTDRGAQRVAA